MRDSMRGVAGRHALLLSALFGSMTAAVAQESAQLQAAYNATSFDHSTCQLAVDVGLVLDLSGQDRKPVSATDVELQRAFGILLTDRLMGSSDARGTPETILAPIGGPNSDYNTFDAQSRSDEPATFVHGFDERGLNLANASHGDATLRLAHELANGKISPQRRRKLLQSAFPERSSADAADAGYGDRSNIFPLGGVRMGVSGYFGGYTQFSVLSAFSAATRGALMHQVPVISDVGKPNTYSARSLAEGLEVALRMLSGTYNSATRGWQGREHARSVAVVVVGGPTSTSDLAAQLDDFQESQTHLVLILVGTDASVLPAQLTNHPMANSMSVFGVDSFAALLAPDFVDRVSGSICRPQCTAVSHCGACAARPDCAWCTTAARCLPIHFGTNLDVDNSVYSALDHVVWRACRDQTALATGSADACPGTLDFAVAALNISRMDMASPLRHADTGDRDLESARRAGQPPLPGAAFDPAALRVNADSVRFSAEVEVTVASRLLPEAVRAALGGPSPVLVEIDLLRDDGGLGGPATSVFHAFRRVSLSPGEVTVVRFSTGQLAAASVVPAGAFASGTLRAVARVNGDMGLPEANTGDNDMSAVLIEPVAITAIRPAYSQGSFPRLLPIVNRIAITTSARLPPGSTLVLLQQGEPIMALDAVATARTGVTGASGAEYVVELRMDTLLTRLDPAAEGEAEVWLSADVVDALGNRQFATSDLVSFSVNSDPVANALIVAAVVAAADGDYNGTAPAVGSPYSLLDPDVFANVSTAANLPLLERELRQPGSGQSAAISRLAAAYLRGSQRLQVASREWAGEGAGSWAASVRVPLLHATSGMELLPADRLLQTGARDYTAAEAAMLRFAATAVRVDSDEVFATLAVSSAAADPKLHLKGRLNLFGQLGDQYLSATRFASLFDGDGARLAVADTEMADPPPSGGSRFQLQLPPLVVQEVKRAVEGSLDAMVDRGALSDRSRGIVTSLLQRYRGHVVGEWSYSSQRWKLEPSVDQTTPVFGMQLPYTCEDCRPSDAELEFLAPGFDDGMVCDSLCCLRAGIVGRSHLYLSPVGDPSEPASAQFGGVAGRPTGFRLVQGVAVAAAAAVQVRCGEEYLLPSNLDSDLWGVDLPNMPSCLTGTAGPLNATDCSPLIDPWQGSASSPDDDDDYAHAFELGPGASMHERAHFGAPAADLPATGWFDDQAPDLHVSFSSDDAFLPRRLRELQRAAVASDINRRKPTLVEIAERATAKAQTPRPLTYNPAHHTALAQWSQASADRSEAVLRVAAGGAAPAAGAGGARSLRQPPTFSGAQSVLEGWGPFDQAAQVQSGRRFDVVPGPAAGTVAAARSASGGPMFVATERAGTSGDTSDWRACLAEPGAAVTQSAAACLGDVDLDSASHSPALATVAATMADGELAEVFVSVYVHQLEVATGGYDLSGPAWSGSTIMLAGGFAEWTAYNSPPSSTWSRERALDEDATTHYDSQPSIAGALATSWALITFVRDTDGDPTTTSDRRLMFATASFAISETGSNPAVATVSAVAAVPPLSTQSVATKASLVVDEFSQKAVIMATVDSFSSENPKSVTSTVKACVYDMATSSWASECVAVPALPAAAVALPSAQRDSADHAARAAALIADPTRSQTDGGWLPDLTDTRLPTVAIAPRFASPEPEEEDGPTPAAALVQPHGAAFVVAWTAGSFPVWCYFEANSRSWLLDAAQPFELASGGPVVGGGAFSVTSTPLDDWRSVLVQVTRDRGRLLALAVFATRAWPIPQSATAEAAGRLPRPVVHTRERASNDAWSGEALAQLEVPSPNQFMAARRSQTVAGASQHTLLARFTLQHDLAVDSVSFTAFNHSSPAGSPRSSVAAAAAAGGSGESVRSLQWRGDNASPTNPGGISTELSSGGTMRVDVLVRNRGHALAPEAAVTLRSGSRRTRPFLEEGQVTKAIVSRDPIEIGALAPNETAVVTFFVPISELNRAASAGTAVMQGYAQPYLWAELELESTTFDADEDNNRLAVLPTMLTVSSVEFIPGTGVSTVRPGVAAVSVTNHGPVTVELATLSVQLTVYQLNAENWWASGSPVGRYPFSWDRSWSLGPGESASDLLIELPSGSTRKNFRIVLEHRQSSSGSLGFESSITDLSLDRTLLRASGDPRWQPWGPDSWRDSEVGRGPFADYDDSEDDSAGMGFGPYFSTDKYTAPGYLAHASAGPLAAVSRGANASAAGAAAVARRFTVHFDDLASVIRGVGQEWNPPVSPEWSLGPKNPAPAHMAHLRSPGADIQLQPGFGVDAGAGSELRRVSSFRIRDSSPGKLIVDVAIANLGVEGAAAAVAEVVMLQRALIGTLGASGAALDAAMLDSDFFDAASELSNPRGAVLNRRAAVLVTESTSDWQDRRNDPPTLSGRQVPADAVVAAGQSRVSYLSAGEVREVSVTVKGPNVRPGDYILAIRVASTGADADRSNQALLVPHAIRPVSLPILRVDDLSLDLHRGALVIRVQGIDLDYARNETLTVLAALARSVAPSVSDAGEWADGVAPLGVGRVAPVHSHAPCQLAVIPLSRQDQETIVGAIAGGDLPAWLGGTTNEALNAQNGGDQLCVQLASSGRARWEKGGWERHTTAPVCSPLDALLTASARNGVVTCPGLSMANAALGASLAHDAGREVSLTSTLRAEHFSGTATAPKTSDMRATPFGRLASELRGTSSGVTMLDAAAAGDYRVLLATHGTCASHRVTKDVSVACRLRAPAVDVRGVVDRVEAGRVDLDPGFDVAQFQAALREAFFTPEDLGAVSMVVGGELLLDATSTARGDVNTGSDGLRAGGDAEFLTGAELSALDDTDVLFSQDGRVPLSGTGRDSSGNTTVASLSINSALRKWLVSLQRRWRGLSFRWEVLEAPRPSLRGTAGVSAASATHSVRKWTAPHQCTLSPEAPEAAAATRRLFEADSSDSGSPTSGSDAVRTRWFRTADTSLAAGTARTQRAWFEAELEVVSNATSAGLDLVRWLGRTQSGRALARAIVQGEAFGGVPQDHWRQLVGLPEGSLMRFTPAVAGIYRLKLTVNHGCSETVREVKVDVRCPASGVSGAPGVRGSALSLRKPPTPVWDGAEAAWVPLQLNPGSRSDPKSAFHPHLDRARSSLQHIIATVDDEPRKEIFGYIDDECPNLHAKGLHAEREQAAHIGDAALGYEWSIVDFDPLPPHQQPTAMDRSGRVRRHSDPFVSASRVLQPSDVVVAGVAADSALATFYTCGVLSSGLEASADGEASRRLEPQSAEDRLRWALRAPVAFVNVSEPLVSRSTAEYTTASHEMAVQFRGGASAFGRPAVPRLRRDDSQIGVRVTLDDSSASPTEPEAYTSVLASGTTLSGWDDGGSFYETHYEDSVASWMHSGSSKTWNDPEAVDRMPATVDLRHIRAPAPVVSGVSTMAFNTTRTASVNVTVRRTTERLASRRTVVARDQAVLYRRFTPSPILHLPRHLAACQGAVTLKVRRYPLCNPSSAHESTVVVRSSCDALVVPRLQASSRLVLALPTSETKSFDSLAFRNQAGWHSLAGAVLFPHVAVQVEGMARTHSGAAAEAAQALRARARGEPIRIPVVDGAAEPSTLAGSPFKGPSGRSDQLVTHRVLLVRAPTGSKFHRESLVYRLGDPDAVRPAAADEELTAAQRSFVERLGAIRKPRAGNGQWRSPLRHPTPFGSVTATSPSPYSALGSIGGGSFSEPSPLWQQADTAAGTQELLQHYFPSADRVPSDWLLPVDQDYGALLFRPDTPGEFVFAVASSTQCATAYDTVRVAASCRAINPSLDLNAAAGSTWTHEARYFPMARLTIPQLELDTTRIVTDNDPAAASYPSVVEALVGAVPTSGNSLSTLNRGPAAKRGPTGRRARVNDQSPTAVAGQSRANIIAVWQLQRQVGGEFYTVVSKDDLDADGIRQYRYDLNGFADDAAPRVFASAPNSGVDATRPLLAVSTQRRGVFPIDRLNAMALPHRPGTYRLMANVTDGCGWTAVSTPSFDVRCREIDLQVFRDADAGTLQTLSSTMPAAVAALAAEWPSVYETLSSYWDVPESAYLDDAAREDDDSTSFEELNSNVYSDGTIRWDDAPATELWGEDLLTFQYDWYNGVAGWPSQLPLPQVSHIELDGVHTAVTSQWSDDYLELYDAPEFSWQNARLVRALEPVEAADDPTDAAANTACASSGLVDADEADACRDVAFSVGLVASAGRSEAGAASFAGVQVSFGSGSLLSSKTVTGASAAEKVMDGYSTAAIASITAGYWEAPALFWDGCQSTVLRQAIKADCPALVPRASLEVEASLTGTTEPMPVVDVVTDAVLGPVLRLRSFAEAVPTLRINLTDTTVAGMLLPEYRANVTGSSFTVRRSTLTVDREAGEVATGMLDASASDEVFEFAGLGYGLHQFQIVYNTGCREVQQRFVVEVVCHSGGAASDILDNDEPLEYGTTATLATTANDVDLPLAFMNVTSDSALGSTRVRSDGVTIYSTAWMGFRQYEPTARQFRAEIDTDALPLTYWDGLNFTEADRLGRLNPTPFSWQLDSWYAYRTLESEVATDAADVSSLAAGADTATVTFSAPGATKLLVTKTGQCTSASGSVWIESACPGAASSRVHSSVAALNAVGAEMVTDPDDDFAARAASPTAPAIVEFDFNDTAGHTGFELFARGAVVASGIPASSGAYPASDLRLPGSWYGAKYSVELVGFEPVGVFAAQGDWNTAINAIMPLSTPTFAAANEAASTLATLARPVVRGDLLIKVTVQDRCSEVSTSTIRLRASCPQEDPDTRLYLVANNIATTNAIEWGSFMDEAFGSGQFEALDDDQTTEDAAYPFSIAVAAADNATAFAADASDRHLPAAQHHYLGFEATAPLAGTPQRFELSMSDAVEPRADGETGFEWFTTSTFTTFVTSPTPGWSTAGALSLQVGSMGRKVNVTSTSFQADQPAAMAAVLVYTADDGGCARTGGTVLMEATCPDMSNLFDIDTSASDGFAFCSSTGNSNAQAANLAVKVALAETASAALTLGAAAVDVVKVDVFDVTDTTLDPEPRYAGLATTNAQRFEAMPLLLATLSGGSVPAHSGAKFVRGYAPTAADLGSRTLRFRADFVPEIDPRLDTERDLLVVVYTSCGPVATKHFSVSVQRQAWDMASSVELAAPWNPDVGAFTTKLSVPITLGDGVQVQDGTRGLRTILSGGVQGPLLRQGPSFAAYGFDTGLAAPFAPGVVAWRWVSSGAPAANLDDATSLHDDSMDDPFVEGHDRTAGAPQIGSRVEDDDAELLAWFAANPGEAPFAASAAGVGVHCRVHTQTWDQRVVVAPIEEPGAMDTQAPNAPTNALQRTRHTLAAVRRCSAVADSGTGAVLAAAVTGDPALATTSWDAVTMLDDTGSLEPAAFLPVAGSYATFELTVDDGCQRKRATVQVSAKCASFSLVAPSSAIRMVVPSAAAYSYIPLTSTVTPEAVASLLGYVADAAIPGDIRSRARPDTNDPVVLSAWSAGLGSGPGAAAGIEAAGGAWRTISPASAPAAVQQADRSAATGSVVEPAQRHNGTAGTVAGAASANPSGMLGGLFGSEAMPIVAVGVNSTGSEVPVLSDRLAFTWRVVAAPPGSVYAGASLQRDARFTARRALGWTDQSANARSIADSSVRGTAPSRVTEEVEVSLRYNETSSVVLTNTHGTTVAFVPDLPGRYTLEVTAADSCPGGTRAAAQVDVEAACPYELALRTAPGGRSVTVGAFVTAGSAARDRNGQRVADTGRHTPAGAHGNEGDALLQGDVDGGVVTLAAAVSVGGGPFSDSLGSAGLLARRSAGVLWANSQDAGASNTDLGDSGQLTFPAALTASWVLVSKPAASSASNGSILDGTSLRPGFLPDVEGEYEFAVTVSDGCASVTERYRLSVGCRSVASPSIVVDRITGGKKAGAVSTDWDERATSRFVLRAELKHEGNLPSDQMLTSAVSTSWLLLPSLATPAGVDGAESRASAGPAGDKVNEAALTIALPLAVGVLALGAAATAGYLLFKKKKVDGAP